MSGVLRIGLVMQGGPGWMGGLEYIRNLVLALDSIRADSATPFKVCLIVGGLLDEGLREQLGSRVDEIHEGLLCKRDTLAERAHYIVQRRLLGRVNARFTDFIRKARLDFLYPLTYDNLYNVGVSLPIGAALGACRWAGWVPDFQHRHMPELFSRTEIAKRDRGIGILARDAGTIVFSSEAAAGDFQQFFPGSPARPEVLRFCTAPNPDWFAGEPLAVQRHYSLPDKFFLVSNQLWQHKNHLVVFEALQRLAGQGVFPTVVCTGQPHDFRNKDYLNFILRRVHELGVAKQICLLGLIPRADQIQLMRRAVAVIQPSLFEGWSTVVEDARALGKPMILSDISVHREQAPERVRYFPGDSAEKLAEQIGQCLATCEPGPVFDDEHRARTEAAEKLQTFGRSFLRIAGERFN